MQKNLEILKNLQKKWTKFEEIPRYQGTARRYPDTQIPPLPHPNKEPCKPSKKILGALRVPWAAVEAAALVPGICSRGTGLNITLGP